MSNTITIYTTRTCPFCVSAKAWLRDRKLEYTEISLDDAADREQFKQSHPGMTTVPQIFVDDRHIGGFSDLATSELA